MKTTSRRGLTASHLVAAVLAAIVNGIAPAEAQTPIRSDAFVVVVNADNPIDDIGRDALSDLFLKRSLKWATGKMANPVDLPAGASTRGAFSRAVLHKPVSAVRTYWQQQIF